MHVTIFRKIEGSLPSMQAEPRDYVNMVHWVGIQLSWYGPRRCVSLVRRKVVSWWFVEVCHSLVIETWHLFPFHSKLEGHLFPFRSVY